MTDAPRVLLAGISHETHTFVTDTTGFDKFTIRRGADLLGCAGDGSMVDGFLEVAAAERWAVVPVAMYRAQPAGRIEHAVFEAFWAELEQGVRQALAEGPLTAIWLALHGAGVTTACDDLEGELLGRLRALPGLAGMPIFGAFDLHANFTAAMARHATALVGFRENPHIDARDTAVRSARLLARCLAERLTPRMVSAHVPVIWPPTGTGTAVSPMLDLEREARRIEAAHPAILAVNVIGGYAFSDVAEAGVAFSLVTIGDEAEARAALDGLCAIALRLRELGQPAEADLDTALTDIQARLAAGTSGPWIVIEPADNIGGGSAGDCTSVLRGLIRHRIGNAVVMIADAEAVAALAPLAPGATTTLAIGGKGDPLDPGPVTLQVRLVSRSDGRFDLEDRNSHMAAANGIHVTMGPSAVVETEGGITILLNSIKTAPMDLGQLRSQGIVPEGKAVIAVKAAVAHRRAYDPIAAGSTIVDTPGACTSRLTALPYRRLRRPIFPLDEG